MPEPDATPQLSISLPREELEGLLDAKAPPTGEGDLPSTEDLPQNGEGLGRHLVFIYLSTPSAEEYRRIMRIFVENKKASGLRLRPDDIRDLLLELYGYTISAETLSRHLDRLCRWGNISREKDTSSVRNAKDFRQKRFSYAITSAGELVEGCLELLDTLTEQIGTLEERQLPEIQAGLTRLASLLEHEPDGEALLDLLRDLQQRAAQLSKGVEDFISQLGQVLERSDSIDEDEFVEYRNQVADHLTRFQQSLGGYSSRIGEQIQRVNQAGLERLLEVIVAAEQYVVPPGRDPEQVRQARVEEHRRVWNGLCAWWVQRPGVDAPWEKLSYTLTQAINALLEIATRLGDGGATGPNRGAAWRHLAHMISDADDCQALLLFQAATGLQHPRHLAVPEVDPDQLDAPASTSWQAAPPAPVSSLLRTPGASAPRRSRGNPIASTAEVGERARQEAEQLRQEAEVWRRRFVRDQTLQLSALGPLQQSEFRRLWQWIDRALVQRADPEGRHRLRVRAHGQLQILLHPPADGARACVQTSRGLLTCPDYHIEVRTTPPAKRAGDAPPVRELVKT